MNNWKKQHPKLKVLLSIGGWNMGSEGFTKMVATSESRARFIQASFV